MKPDSTILNIKFRPKNGKNCMPLYGLLFILPDKAMALEKAYFSRARVVSSFVFSHSRIFPFTKLVGFLCSRYTHTKREEEGGGGEEKENRIE